jgi:hypothetical protein
MGVGVGSGRGSTQATQKMMMITKVATNVEAFKVARHS